MTIQAGQIITIGTAKFIIDDIRDGHRVGDIALRYTLREGFIKLNGATVLRADYPRLVQWVNDNNLWTSDSAALGLFGIGNGSTTMRLPDFRNRFLEGVDSNGGDIVEAGLPNITGNFNRTLQYEKSDEKSGVFSDSTDEGSCVAPGSSCRWINMNFNASNSDAIYGNSNTVQPPAIRLIAQIKY